MTTKAPITGATVYGRDGRHGEYVAAIAAGHLVRPVATFTDWEGFPTEEPTDALEIWTGVFPTAPVHLQAAEFTAIQAGIKTAKEELRALEAETREAQRAHLDLLKRLTRYEPLKNLEAILDGTITHFVEASTSASARIVERDAALVYRDDYGRKDLYRLLTLKPTADGVIQWHITQYSGGAGSGRECYPCTSFDEAKRVAAAVICAALARFDFAKSPHIWKEAAISAAALGVTLPPEVAERAAAFDQRRAQAAIANAEAELEAARENLARVSAA